MQIETCPIKMAKGSAAGGKRGSCLPLMDEVSRYENGGPNADSFHSVHRFLLADDATVFLDARSSHLRDQLDTVRRNLRENTFNEVHYPSCGSRRRKPLPRTQLMTIRVFYSSLLSLTDSLARNFISLISRESLIRVSGTHLVYNICRVV